MKIVNGPTVYANVIRAAKITLNDVPNKPEIAVTAVTTIAGAANFKMRAIVDYIDDDTRNATIKIEVNMYALDNQPHTFNLTSTALKLNRCIRASVTTEDKWHTIHNNTFTCIHEYGSYRTTGFDLRCELILGANDQILRQRALSMLDDDQTTDVELVGTDGSIRAHGCLLAAASPYMRAAFYGGLDETRERRLTVPDVNVAALRLLKQFMYTGYVDVTKDSSTLMMVLSMASCNLMPDFGRACISSLDECTAEELWSLLHDAFEHKHQDLILEVLNRLDTKKVDVIRSQLEEPIREVKENVKEENDKK